MDLQARFRRLLLRREERDELLDRGEPVPPEWTEEIARELFLIERRLGINLTAIEQRTLTEDERIEQIYERLHNEEE
jgi:hypothetical protein